MKSISIIITTIVLSFIVLNSCKKEKQITSGVELKLPNENFDYILDNSKAKIGRILFYDKALSVNNSISCGSCHKQELAFSDDKILSPGFNNRIGNRNTPPIQNINANFQSLFWDARETSLKSMVTKPVFNHIEMGVKSNEYLLANLKAQPYYASLFVEAFPNGKVTIENISECLTNFIGSMETNNSEFDRPVESRSFEVNEGEKLFFGKYNCGSCHNVRNPKGYNGGDQIGGGNTFFTTNGNEITLGDKISEDEIRKIMLGQPMVNIGLDMNYSDKGFAEVTGDLEDNGKFKIPNLRNIMLTAPYMHDGRFNSIDEVLDFYSKGIKQHKNLDIRLLSQDLKKPQVLSISKEERTQLKAFLNSLTDHNFISDSKFSDPFTKK